MAHSCGEIWDWWKTPGPWVKLITEKVVDLFFLCKPVWADCKLWIELLVLKGESSVEVPWTCIRFLRPAGGDSSGFKNIYCCMQASKPMDDIMVGLHLT